MIEVTSEAMDRAQRLLAGIPKGAERAFASAINRGLSHAKSQAFRQAKAVYAVKASALNGASRTRVKAAGAGSLAGHVLFSGVKIPLYQFNASSGKDGKRVRAGLKKGSLTAFDHAFAAKMRSGHIGIFERKSEKRFPIKEIMGLSAAQMVGNEVVIDELSEEARKKVEERVAHEIDRIINGYGG